MRYAFGAFVADTSTLELRRDGELVSIEPQVFELLVFLIENRERVSSKDDLIEAVWDGRIVSDAAISSRIRLVRRAVDDDGTRQEVIKTVHGKGFRFIAELRESATQTEPDSRTEMRDPPEPVNTPAIASESTSSSRLAVWAGLAISAFVGLFLIIQMILVSGSGAQNRIAVLPVTNQTGDPSLDWVELGLMSLVIHDLETRSELPILRDRTIMTLADRFEKPDPTELQIDPKLETALKRGYGVSHVLVSQLVGTADNLTLEYRMINPRGQSSLTKVSGQLAAELAESMSRQIAASLPRSGERLREPSSLQFDDAYITETYARGLNLQMQGKAAEAADLFRVAAAHVPNNLEVKYEIAVSTRMAGDLDDAEAQLLSLVEAAMEAGNDEVHGAAINALGIIYMTRRDDQAALETYEKALAILETVDSAERRAHTLTNMGIVQRRLRNFEAAEEVLGRARVEYQAAGYETTPGHLLNTLAVLKVQTRDVPTANEYLSEALAYFRLVGDRRSEAVAMHNIGSNASDMGELEKAETMLTEALALREEMGDFRGQMSSLASLAQLKVNAGFANEANGFAVNMARLANENGDKYQLARAEISLSHINFVLGDWQTALDHSQSAQALYESLSRERQSYRETIRQAVIQAFKGKMDGRADIQTVLDWAIAENQRGTQLVALEALVVLSLIGGDLGGASDNIDAAVTLATEMQLHAPAGYIAARQGLIRLMRGDETGAMASLGRAKSGYPDHRETLLLDGLLKHAAGDKDAGASAVAAAKDKAGDNWLILERLFHPLLEAA